MGVNNIGFAKPKSSGGTPESPQHRPELNPDKRQPGRFTDRQSFPVHRKIDSKDINVNELRSEFNFVPTEEKAIQALAEALPNIDFFCPRVRPLEPLRAFPLTEKAKASTSTKQLTIKNSGFFRRTLKEMFGRK